VNAQLPLALRYPPDQRLETFVAAPGTLLAGAVAQVAMLADGRDASGKLYLAGPAGSGKTHLLLAACAQADASGRKAAYLPLASAAGRLREALEALDGYDLLALDGLEAAMGNDADELALFALHNRAHDAGSAVLYAARSMPAALDARLPDLQSRLAQCTCVVLDPLDDAGRREVLRLRAERRGLQVDAAAFDWLLRRVGRDLSTLTTLLDRLDRASLAAQRRVTVPFLREVLGREEPLA
jgi:DnaA family protein